ncbi:MAG TPA: 23S rRNA (pseudouridine(1915)-N(3))-methyltransferase RlmH [Candidatus Sulfotelmatobacter sp.]|nr:23S rRNA (pseudouridine(1915)-N(3))-methyltransferase RlmH [Candidatus Sulfotelmatobacter sp.]
MRVGVLSVGKPERARFGPLFDDYAERLVRLGVTFDARFVAEVKAGGRYSEDHVREREAKALDSALPERGVVVSLSPEGRTLDSIAFARKLDGWWRSRVTFVVGGPLGLDPGFMARSDLVLSLSAMTLPHELARVLLIEQVYRAATILRGVPYHK